MVTKDGILGKYEGKEINANDLKVKITAFNNEGIPVVTAHEPFPHFIDDQKAWFFPIVLQVLENEFNIDKIYIDLN